MPCTKLMIDFGALARYSRPSERVEPLLHHCI